jgi:hypothetical protein
MTEMRQKTGLGDVKATMPPFRMPNVTSMAVDMLNKALEFGAQKMGYDNAHVAIERLHQGNQATRQYCLYSIAEQVGDTLGSLDENVKAVYIFDHDATAEDVIFGEERPPLVHLLVWVERKTEALNSLVTMLDRALANSYGQRIGPRELVHLLDVQVIDDADVAQRSGYAALLQSLHHRPIRIWER